MKEADIALLFSKLKCLVIFVAFKTEIFFKFKKNFKNVYLWDEESKFSVL